MPKAQQQKIQILYVNEESPWNFAETVCFILGKSPSPPMLQKRHRGTKCHALHFTSTKLYFTPLHELTTASKITTASLQPGVRSWSVSCAVGSAPAAPTSWTQRACACNIHQGVALRHQEMPAWRSRPVESPLRRCRRVPWHPVLQLSGHSWRLPGLSLSLVEHWWEAGLTKFSEIFSPWCATLQLKRDAREEEVE